jgi:hypothetical protein
MLQQHRQILERLLLELNLHTGFAKLSGAQIHLKLSKANRTICEASWVHAILRKRERHAIRVTSILCESKSPRSAGLSVDLQNLANTWL